MSHVALMEVLQNATVVQEKIKVAIQRLVRFTEGNRVKSCLAIREGEPVEIEDRLVRSIRLDWPLQCLIALEPLIAHAGVEWGQRSHLSHDFGRVLVVPQRAHPFGN